MSSKIKVSTFFSASISLNNFKRISSGSLAVSLAAPFPSLICLLKDFSRSFVSSEIKQYRYRPFSKQSNSALYGTPALQNVSHNNSHHFSTI
jgi:hypothetical protein